jgi:hypothetical protein
VRNRLRKRGIRARCQYVGCVLTPRHRTARLNWCTLHRRWTRQQWATVLFSDESRFTLHSKDGRTRVNRRNGERYSDACVNPVNHFQASIMVWGGITSTSKLNFAIIRGNMNAQSYFNNVLNPADIPFINQHDGVSFQHDNARRHTARITTQHLQQNNVNVLPWPACSP